MTLLNNRPRKTLKFNTSNEFFANFMPNKKLHLVVEFAFHIVSKNILDNSDFLSIVFYF
jgi:hypothetical protein